jgi:uroporphyrinogen decarboxylase
MQQENLKKHFGDSISFVGGIDTQVLLPRGSPSEVKQKVAELKKLFPTGMVMSPSHEAVLPNVNPANIEAIFQAVKNRKYSVNPVRQK